MPAPRLLDLQRGFADAVLERSDAVAAWVDGAGLEPAARLRIYRHSIAATQADALRDSYPAVLALVGEDFFQRLAARHAQQFPATAGNLQHYGGALDQCIDAMPAARALGYLADVARLEWRRQLAALASDASALDAGELNAAMGIEPENLRLILHPSLHVLRSEYAVLSLWQWCQAPDDTPPDPRRSGEHVLIWRDEGAVTMAAVEPATLVCIEALSGGRSVAAAYGAACDMDGQFNIQPCLGDLLAHRLIVACSGQGRAG